MKKKLRVLAIIGGVVALVAVALACYADREHPDYVRAAKLLPAARLEAKAMFGPLTWEEYRAENGITFRDDIAAWEEVASNIPPAVKTQYETRGPLRNERAVFLAEREWFFQVRSQVEDLRLMHVLDEDGEFWAFSFSSCKDIIKALGVGIDGAAEAGDAEAVLEIGRTSNTIMAAFNEEPSLIHHLVTFALLAIIDHSILRAAVRNRNDPAFIKSVQTVLDERPPLPTIREVMNADARSMNPEMRRIGKMAPSEIEEWLDNSGFQEFLDEQVSPIADRDVGKHTAAALEARYWQSVVKYTTLLENLVARKPNARQELNALDETLEHTEDRSYEYAASPVFSTVVDVHISFGFDDSALRAAVALMERYPLYADLPEALPADLSFADPFGGGPIIYRKTPRGFLIYTRFVNGTDDGFPLIDPDELGREASITLFLNREDAGLIVSYDPIVPAP